MNILYLLYVGFDRHGPSLHLWKSLVKESIERGHNVKMIVRHRGGSDPDVPKEFLSYDSFSYDVINDSPLEKSALIKRYFEDIAYAFKACKLYRKYHDIDVVFLQSNTSPLFSIYLLKKTLRCPVLFNVQNIFPIDALVLGKLQSKGIKGIAFKIMRRMQKKAYNMADVLVTISQDMKKTICRENVDQEKVKVVYNWSYDDDPIIIEDDDNLFVNAHPEVKNKFRVVFAGNLGAMVNPYIIADAAQRLQCYDDILFIIIGAGNNMEKLKELVQERNIDNMNFYPYQPIEFAPHNYAMAHVNINALPKGIIETCLPSKTATMLNSMRPMVVAVELDSEYASILHRVDKCTVVNWDDLDGFVSGILKIYKSKDYSNSLNARIIFKEYFSENNAKEYITILEELLSKKLVV